jgi:hypothetical protein
MKDNQNYPMSKDEICLAMAEQHKNTRYDAIDKMNEIRARYAEHYDYSLAEDMLNEITGAIFNLKQRSPNIF